MVPIKSLLQFLSNSFETCNLSSVSNNHMQIHFHCAAPLCNSKPFFFPAFFLITKTTPISAPSCLCNGKETSSPLPWEFSPQIKGQPPTFTRPQDAFPPHRKGTVPWWKPPAQQESGKATGQEIGQNRQLLVISSAASLMGQTKQVLHNTQGWTCSW